MLMILWETEDRMNWEKKLGFKVSYSSIVSHRDEVSLVILRMLTHAHYYDITCIICIIITTTTTTTNCMIVIIDSCYY